ncbi:MAG: hypothetical protein ACK40L_17300 [Hydrogenophaga sp.]|jgi:hypothetical protein
MTAARVAVWTAAAIALLGTLMLYQQPGFMVNLAEQLWSCF